MPNRFSHLLDALRERRRIPLFERCTAFVARLSPGDKLIAGVLALAVIGSSLAGLIALERSFLVKVPAYGGSLTEGVVGSPRFVNPLLALSDADRDLTALAYAGLMGTGGDGSLVPVLAESYTVSEDGKVYTFTLKENVAFSDGTPVTAEDIVFTVERAQDPGLKSPQLANWANIRAKAEDARTVSFTLPKPYAPFLEDTTLGILPAHLWKNVPTDEFPFSPLMQEPVGAGPFKVSQVVRNKAGVITEYRLASFKGYALGRPYLSGMRFIFFKDQDALEDALASGRVESAYGIPGDGALRAPYARVFGVFFNHEDSPALARLEVRKALSLAIDRDRIVNEVLGGYATPLAGPVPPGSGIELPALPDPSTRLADARKALTDAGWTFDEEAHVWENAKLKLSIDSLSLRTSDIPELKAVASVVRDEWQELGIPVSLELYAPADLAQQVIRPRAYEALLFGMVVGRERDLFAFWDSGERSDPGLNIAGYANRSVDALLDTLREETDQGKAAEALQEASDSIAADYPAAFTHAPEFLYAVPKGLEGVRLPQITSPADRFATVASWHRRSEYVWPFLAR